MRATRPLLLLAAVLTLAACGGRPSSSASTPGADPTTAALQARLAMLPAVEDARRTALTPGPGRLSETFRVADGAPACRQVLTELDAAGYAIVAGDGAGAPVDPATCTAKGATVDESAGAASVLAQGGSTVALVWTATDYTLTVTTAG